MEASPNRKLSASEFALAQIRASSGVLADAESFSRSLASGIVEPFSGMAVEMHLREADPAGLADLVADGAATFHSLAALSDQLVEHDHPNYGRPPAARSDHIARQKLAGKAVERD